MASLPPVGGGSGGGVEVASVSPVGGGPPGVPASPLVGPGLAGAAVQAMATVIKTPSKGEIAISLVDLKVVCLAVLSAYLSVVMTQELPHLFREGSAAGTRHKEAAQFQAGPSGGDLR